jgi:hypothetical protein
MLNMSNPNILEAVVAELEKRTGDLRRVADESGIPYDTILRIKNQESDPGFSRVQALHDYLFKSQVPAGA